MRLAARTLAFRAAVSASRWVPEPVADGLCRLIGRAAYLLAAQARSNVLANLSHVLPRADEAQVRRAAKVVFYHVARNYYDLLRARWVSPARRERHFTFQHLERLTGAIATGRGVIVVAPHVGNFNLVPDVAAARGIPSIVMMERLEPPALYEFLAQLRGGQGVRIVPADRHGLRSVVAALRRGEVIVLASDRDVTGSGVVVPFFGWPARLPAGPATLAQRTGAVLLPMYTRRLDRRRSVVVVQEPVTPARTGIPETDLVATTTRLAGALETAIRSAPEQWVVLQAIWGDAEPGGDVRWRARPAADEAPTTAGLGIDSEAAGDEN
jgi:KDO2-lipid IV(A) lauroyltransferase